MPLAVADRQEVTIILADFLCDAPNGLLVQRNDEVAVPLLVDGEIVLSSGSL